MLKSLVILLIVMLVGFCAHAGFLHAGDVDFWPLLIWQSYLANFILGVIGFLGLVFLSKRLGGLLGYVFFAYSFVKVIVFLAGFRPVYAADGEVSRLEFLIFFVPYILALVVEIWALSRILTQSDEARKENTTKKASIKE